MYKVLRPDKDAYITDRVIKGERAHSANVGQAGSLDLFKLYGITATGSNPNIELSRLLIHFDLDPLRELVTDGKVDITNPSFHCRLRLFDVYGGQPTPINFTIDVAPLSRSFDEGLGRDVVYYGDGDVCNFLTGSRTQGAWLLSGCNLGGGMPGTVDYVTASTGVASGISLVSSQLFQTGEEDLDVDVTTVISATLSGLLPDQGFRLALDSDLEVDTRTYFVKRFAGRAAFNEDKRPRLIVKYDDSIQDDSQALYFDSPSYLFLYNYVRQAPANLTSGSSLTPVTGSNSLILKLATEISGGWHELTFSGSQHTNGSNPVTGIYSASVNIPSTNAILAAKLATSGSVKLTPIWSSRDGTVGFLTGSAIYAYAAQRGASSIAPRRFVVTTYGIQDEYESTDESVLRVHIFDQTLPSVRLLRTPTEMPGIVVRDVHYRIRDVITDKIEIPFDTDHNSTRLSSDATGMYFKLDASNLTRGRSYVIDVMIVTGDNSQVYRNASPSFKVRDLP